ncbi:hypothetical protein OIU84_019465 [Salix udensis]|uniref:RING-type domain-containing protein n=1 Tax=Salix udensis TaxID=889485 RepID=A0AAD6KYY9_9ROSI|nr:hypothetical protein OIU84_019465 [Salix udensis]
MMWRFASNALSSIGLKKSSREASRDNLEFSDDDACSNASREEGLECPICWESFNIVENVPYVLWCGHSLCENCVLGLQCAVLGFSMQKIRIPFFVSCPWCQLLSFRLVYQGSLKFPRKNFFLLWMVERLNGDRVKLCSSLCINDNQPLWTLKGNLVFWTSTLATVASVGLHIIRDRISWAVMQMVVAEMERRIVLLFTNLWIIFLTSQRSFHWSSYF